jgi:AGZA family xanthine/uracil permease-like MFS transporter
MAKAGLRAAGFGAPGGPEFSEALIQAFLGTDTWIHGAFALEQGFILTAMILAATTVCIIERRFLAAAVWTWSAAALAALGLIHSYRFTVGDTAGYLVPAWPWALGYALMGGCFFVARWVTEGTDKTSDR